MRHTKRMRIVAWNCRQGFDAKASALLALGPDIAVVPESKQLPAITQASLLAPAIPHRWAGPLATKGLGVFAPGADSLDVVDPERSVPGDWSMAVKARHANRETVVVGVWTVPPYLAAANAIVNRHEEALASGNAILAGDFNVAGNTNGRADKAGLLGLMKRLRERCGLVSAYPAWTGHAVGEESVGTLWWKGDPAQAYHCDFVFVPQTWRILKVEVGGYAEWGAPGAKARSDHAPVIVDVER